MKHETSLYIASAMIAVVVTFALIMGHTTQVVWIGVAGTLTVQGVLANILRGFK